MGLYYLFYKSVERRMKSSTTPLSGNVMVCNAGNMRNIGDDDGVMIMIMMKMMMKMMMTTMLMMKMMIMIMMMI